MKGGGGGEGSAAADSQQAADGATSILNDRFQRHLLPFQREGIAFGVKTEGRCLIGDEMGLGKTLQAIGVAAHFHDEFPLLIMAPSSVKFSWASELEKWTRIRPTRIKLVRSRSDVDSLRNADVTICTYGMLTATSTVIDAMQKARFQVVILDESHYIKNDKTTRYQLLCPILKSSKRLILLSGTPALSRPVELYPQLSALHPSLFGKYYDFVKKFCNAHHGRFGYDVSGSSNVAELHKLLKQVMIRRLKSEVLTQLPSKIRQRVVIDVPPNQLKAMRGTITQLDDLRKSVNSLFNSGPRPHDDMEAGELHKEQRRVLMEGYRMTGEAKLTGAVAYMTDVMQCSADTDKVLVFAHHKVMLDALEQWANRSKLGYIRIDGSVPAGERHRLVTLFQRDGKYRVALLSMTAAGQGITLTAAQRVVFCELSWTPGVLLQAEDRAHRIGQKGTVNVVYLMAEGYTLDSIVWAAIARKTDFLSKALDGRKERMSAELVDHSDAVGRTGEQELTEFFASEASGRETPRTAATPFPKGDVRSFFTRKKDAVSSNTTTTTTSTSATTTTTTSSSSSGGGGATSPALKTPCPPTHTHTRNSAGTAAVSVGDVHISSTTTTPTASTAASPDSTPLSTSSSSSSPPPSASSLRTKTTHSAARAIDPSTTPSTSSIAHPSTSTTPSPCTTSSSSCSPSTSSTSTRTPPIVVTVDDDECEHKPSVRGSCTLPRRTSLSSGATSTSADTRTCSATGEGEALIFKWECHICTLHNRKHFPPSSTTPTDPRKTLRCAACDAPPPSHVHISPSKPSPAKRNHECSHRHHQQQQQQQHGSQHQHQQRRHDCQRPPQQEQRVDVREEDGGPLKRQRTQEEGAPVPSVSFEYSVSANTGRISASGTCGGVEVCLNFSPDELRDAVNSADGNKSYDDTVLEPLATLDPLQISAAVCELQGFVKSWMGLRAYERRALSDGRPLRLPLATYIQHIEDAKRAKTPCFERYAPLGELQHTNANTQQTPSAVPVRSACESSSTSNPCRHTPSPTPQTLDPAPATHHHHQQSADHQHHCTHPQQQHHPPPPAPYEHTPASVALKTASPLRPPRARQLLCGWCGKSFDGGSLLQPLRSTPSKRQPGGARHVYCSYECGQELLVRAGNSSLIRRQLFQLEHGICQLCGIDAHALYNRIKSLAPPERVQVLMGLEPHVARGVPEAAKTEPTPGHFWQADHQLPVAEGGGCCGLENFRTLCTGCHMRETASLKARLKVAKTAAAAVGTRDIRQCFLSQGGVVVVTPGGTEKQT